MADTTRTVTIVYSDCPATLEHEQKHRGDTSPPEPINVTMVYSYEVNTNILTLCSQMGTETIDFKNYTDVDSPEYEAYMCVDFPSIHDVLISDTLGQYGLAVDAVINTVIRALLDIVPIRGALDGSVFSYHRYAATLKLRGVKEPIVFPISNGNCEVFDLTAAILDVIGG